MGTKIRIQEYIKSSNRTTLSQKGYDDIRTAYINLRGRARLRYHKYGKYTIVDGRNIYVNNASISQEGDTIVVTIGRFIRVFSLVIVGQAGNIPFSHMTEPSIPIRK